MRLPNRIVAFINGISGSEPPLTRSTRTTKKQDGERAGTASGAEPGKKESSMRKEKRMLISEKVYPVVYYGHQLRVNTDDQDQVWVACTCGWQSRSRRAHMNIMRSWWKHATQAEVNARARG